MEKDGIPSPKDLEVYIKAAELSHVAGKILHLAKKRGLYTETPGGDLFAILEGITIAVINDDRADLLDLGNLIMEFNHQRDQVPPNKLRFVVTPGQNGVPIIEFSL